MLPGTFRLHPNALLLSTLRRLWCDQRGGTLVETAISFLLLLALIFGVIEGSLAVYSYHFLASAAHEATRYAIVRGGGWDMSCDGSGSTGSGYGSSGCTANATDVANYVANRNFPGLRITAADVCVEYLGSSPGSATTACTASTANTDNVPGDIVQVTISYPYTISVPGLPRYSFTMSSTSAMAISQ
jgi:Flp pilus assembly protein TadG